VADLQRRRNRLRAAPAAPGEIAFGTVEAAVLLHAEAGLAALLAESRAESEAHLGASLALLEWSRDAAHRLQERGEAVTPRIPEPDFPVTLAAAALALGSPAAAQPFALAARRAAPLDPQVQLVSGCVAEGLAELEVLLHRESEAGLPRHRAESAFRHALALDPGLHEARLHLGNLLRVQGRLVEAEPLLVEVEARTGDPRQRYLARLFLGGVAEGRGRHDDAARLFARALEAWPDSQAARFGLARALEARHGPAAARLLVGASVSASRRLDRAADPWWLYPLGPPGFAEAAVAKLWEQVLGR
jgi:tetratricopeptide (TPR) repeat protein